MDPINIEPDQILDDGRQQFLKVTGKALNLEHVERRCSVYGTDASKMTNARLFARFMSKFRIYNPLARKDVHSYTQSGKPLPSLDTAWAHWEHVTLARQYLDVPGYIRSELGELRRPTGLYPVWRTPVKELMAWGVSVRLYFSTLLTLSAFLGVAGFLNLPLINYFSSYSYADDGKVGIDRSIRGSAVCDEAYWVECESCNDEYASYYPAYRLDGENVLVNNCNFDDWLVPGIFSYAASVLLIIMFGVAYFWLQRKAEVVFDEEIQTASDYSVKISNPPRDALDPEEWKRFLSRFAGDDVALVTIAVDNAPLINALVMRRKIMRKLRRALEPFDVDFKDDAALKELVKRSMEAMSCPTLPFVSSPLTHYKKFREINERVRGLLGRQYGAAAVFVTFETERAQRSCLHALSTGKVHVWRNMVDLSRFEGNRLVVQEAAGSSKLNIGNLTESLNTEKTKDVQIELVASQDGVEVEQMLKFRQEKVLIVKEAGEPNDVRWKDLQVPFHIRSLLVLATTVVLIIFITWSGFFIYGLEKNNPGSPYTALFITITNILVPKVCDAINGFEVHAREADRIASLYIKVALFRLFNSALCLSLVLDFVQTISVQNGNESEAGLPATVYMTIYAEMFTIPIIKLVDIMGNIRKHVLAPRAADQEEMNNYFSGGRFELAERYSDATKVLFVALYYSAIVPQSLFLGSIALLAHYWSGKFCLLRLWRQTPDIGPHLARLSRNYFFSASLFVHVVMSAYFWSGYPYDQVCEDNGAYEFCDQDLFRSNIFPPLPRNQPGEHSWMTPSQEILTALYGYTSLVMVGIMTVVVLYNLLLPEVLAIFKSVYEPDGEDQNIPFSSVKHRQEVHGYIPQVRDPGFPHPLIACDLNGIDGDLVGWKDNSNGFEVHNLVNDARQVLGGQALPPHCFSVVKQWSPPSAK
eukprot:Nitzschia sp. Nitz4//scaffold13_size275219//14448//17225//NITZ4_000836-RA/size275219-processed-gene-0.67-mRNA-1//1//CDS//3329535900//9314//frame0